MKPDWQKGNIRLFNDNCLNAMQGLGDNCIDLTVTSPPYDNLREYNGNNDQWSEDVWKAVIEELYRVTKNGGVVVWVVGDATVNGSETGTSFKQALHAMDCGFNLHDTMVYSKGGQGATGSNLSYWQDFEYMFIFSKGKIKTFNPICDRKNKVAPRKRKESQGHRFADGETKPKRVITRRECGRRFNIWQYHESGTRIAHPAVFPEQLVHDHIISWSNEGDLVFDPFMGSGTTGVGCIKTGRQFIGIELDAEYFDIAKKRIEKHMAQGRLF